MTIFLGNMGITEIEKRVGVQFPQELVDYMKPRRQEIATDIEPGKWHCFDIPFTLVCGDRKTANTIYKYLSPLSHNFTTPLQIKETKGKRQ